MSQKPMIAIPVMTRTLPELEEKLTAFWEEMHL